MSDQRPPRSVATFIFGNCSPHYELPASRQIGSVQAFAPFCAQTSGWPTAGLPLPCSFQA